MAMKASQIFVAEIAEQISLPDAYYDIRQLIEQRDSSIQDFVDVIEQDRMLSIRLQRIAESTYFGFPSSKPSLYQTVSLIGTMQLHDIVLNCICLRTFTTIPRQIFDMHAFWSYSVGCAIACRTIAQHGQLFPINPFFTLGLLHEIGHALMYLRKPDLSAEALQLASANHRSLISSEQQLFGFDYTEVGSMLMKQWRLPERFQQINAFHLQPELADEAHHTAVNVVNLAHQICDNPRPGENQSLVAEARERDPELRRLPDNISDIIIKEIQANSDEVLAILWPPQSLPEDHIVEIDDL